GETMTGDEIAALFHRARANEYQEVVQGCRDILRHLDRYQKNHPRSVPQLRGKLDGLKRELDRIQSIDYLTAPAGERARTLWETTARRLRAAEAGPPPARGGRHRTSLPPPRRPPVTPPP